MGVNVRRVMMQAVGETDGIAGMKFLGEFPHDSLQARMQNVVGIDSDGHQRVVLFLRHRKGQPVRDNRTLCLRRKSFQMSLPGGSRARAVGISADAVVQKTSGVNLFERFF